MALSPEPIMENHIRVAFATVNDRDLIDVSKLTITKTDSPKELQRPEELVFGGSFTDHMLCIKWKESIGWLAPQILPYQSLSIDPGACGIQYACQCFEGMKAYKDSAGAVRLFRPEENMKRFSLSAALMSLPSIDGPCLIELIGILVDLDKRFIPNLLGYSLYLRPTLIATNSNLGVSPPTEALLYVIASPVGPYHSQGFKAITVEAADIARAWPGGSGNRKIGANYGPTLLSVKGTKKRGFDASLWLFGEEEYITEAGTMNLFFAMKNPVTGQRELVTPPVDGLILEGVTRNSVLSLAHEFLVPDGWSVAEKYITMKELVNAAVEGRLLEVFGTGTAAIVSPVRAVSWRGKTILCGISAGEEAGEVTKSMKSWIEARQYGLVEHPWSFKVPPRFEEATVSVL